MKTKKYKGFIGEFEWIAEEQIYYGKIIDVTDLITFQAYIRSDIEYAFQSAVDDYLELKSCK